jgi:L-threonylcarbamoyladenylate synthase
VLVADLAAADRLAVVDDRARTVADRFWPGALTLVLRRSEASSDWDLGVERETIGIRVPHHEVALALLRRTGPLAVTSANRSGQPTSPDCDGVRAMFGDAVSVYLCAGRAAGSSSTVVDLTGPRPRVLRRGAIPEEQILSAWTRSV